MLQLVDISKAYKLTGQKVEALKNVSLSFGRSEFIAVLGPSGCGKTTLLNVIGGLDRYDSGDLIIEGRSTKKYRDRDWDTYRNHSCGFVFQSYNLIPHQTVFANVELSLTLAGIKSKERKRRVNEALDSVGLSDQKNKKPNQMSGGQMQRVAIARALVNNPEILLADEPTGALDSKTSEQIMQILSEISNDRLIIMVTHNPELAEKYATRIIRLMDGRVISDEPNTPAVCAADTRDDGSAPAQEPGNACEETEKIKADALEETVPASDAAETYKPVFTENRGIIDTAINRFRSISEEYGEGETAHSSLLKEAGSIANVAENSGETAGKTAAITEQPSDAGTENEVTEETVADVVSAGVVENNKAVKASETPADNSVNNSQKYSKGRKKRTSMSFFTALSLSFNNLLTKKGRTFMTAFAGSIGIIGIALILAMSTGVNRFIDDVQKDTLSSYPISIEAEEVDLSSILAQMADNTAKKDPHEPGMIYSSSRAYDMFNAFFSATKKTNNLVQFKKWLDSEMAKGPSEGRDRKNDASLYDVVTAVRYGYNMSLKTFVKDENGEYRSTDLSGLYSDAGSDSGMYSVFSQSESGASSFSLWHELLPGKDGEIVAPMIKDQYDLLYGRWPEKLEDVVIVVDRNNEVNDLAFYTLGLMGEDELRKMIAAAMSRTVIENQTHFISFEDLSTAEIMMVLPADLYTDQDGDGVFQYAGDDRSLLSMIVRNGLKLNICGVIRKNPDATSTGIPSSAVFCYTSLLTDYVIDKNAESPAAAALIASEGKNIDILTGKPFTIEENELTEAEKAAKAKETVANMSDAEKAELYKKILTTPDEEYIKEQLDKIIVTDNREEAEKMIAENYGLDISFISDYLKSYTDEELFAMIREGAEATIRENFAKESETKIRTIVRTPTAEEHDFFKKTILAMNPGREKGTALILNYWNETGAMPAETGAAYLASLDDVSFSVFYDRILDNITDKLYAERAEGDPAVAERKLAAALDEEIGSAGESKLAEYYAMISQSEISENSYDKNLETLGILDTENPAYIRIYPATFEDKDTIAEKISEYNKGVEKDDQISYTDYVAALMSGITTIINAISYVLIAFVAVSLVVSSIMIGIITYISVLERTKEIGILRAVGASKNDVSRVFTAETLIIGFISGLIGIGASLILCYPINLIIHHYTNLSNINAVLPWQACVVLVIISMLLTLIAGLFPSRSAAHKDPVEALRTE